jgi:hypothetical protein
MKKEKSWKLLVMLMLKIEISVSIHKTMESINNGTSFMQMNGKVNQGKEN